MVIQMVENYYLLGDKDKARELGLKMADALLDSSRFYLEFIDFSSTNFESVHRCLMYLADTFRQYGDKELSDKILDSLDLLIRVATGESIPEEEDVPSVDTMDVE